jgi:hypothetical protein
MTGWTEEQITIVADLMKIPGNDTGKSMFSYMVKNFKPEYKPIMKKGSVTIGRKMGKMRKMQGISSHEEHAADVIAAKEQLIHCVVTNFVSIGQENGISDNSIGSLSSQAVRMISNFKFI